MALRELMRDMILTMCRCSGSATVTLDVWEPDCAFRHNEPVTAQTNRWIGTVPSSFYITHLRVSCNSNTGISLTAGLQIGQHGVSLGDVVWPYVAARDSLLIPFASLNSGLTSPLLPAGARIKVDTAVTGVYGTQMNGLQFAFIGRWIK